MKTKAHQCEQMGYDFIIYDDTAKQFVYVSEDGNNAIHGIKFCPHCAEKLEVKS